jgi:hypothetical protein
MEERCGVCRGNHYLPDGTQCPVCVELAASEVAPEDPINPRHYKSHPSGVECIQITEHMNFCVGNAIKYLWRCGEKPSDDPVEDLKKARWYIDREIARLTSN